MGAFASISEVINRLSGGNSGNPQFIACHKEWRVAGAVAATPIAGQEISLWEFEGIPSHGAVPPAAFAIPDNTTQGGLKQVDPTGGRQLWLCNALGLIPQAGKLTLYDRLLHKSGLDATVTTAQNINGGADATVTRYTNGLGNQIWIEIYTQVGVSAQSITVAYKNQAGVAKTTQAVIIGNTNRREAQRIIRCPLAAGDTGVTAVVSATLAVSTGTAGNFGIVVAHPLVGIPVSLATGAMAVNYLDGSMPEILTDACLAMTMQATAVTVGGVELDVTMAER